MLLDDIDVSEIKKFPFQSQISYTALNGDKCMRVITKLQVVSNEREEVEKKADTNMLMRNCIQQSAKVARDGDVKQAQVIAKTWNRHVRNNLQSEQQVNEYQSFNQNFGAVYAQLGTVKEEEAKPKSSQMKSKKND